MQKREAELSNGMIARMVDLPMGIGRTTYTLCRACTAVLQ